MRAAEEVGWHATQGNIVSAYVTPTLRNLQLIEGSGSKLKLTSDGHQCLDAFRHGGESAFLSRLGLQIINIDRQSGSLIEKLMAKHSAALTAVTMNQFKQELLQLGHREATRGTRVSSWLSLLRFVGLVASENGKYYANSYQFEALLKGDPDINSDEFLAVLEREYLSVLRHVKGSTYVPIPRLRAAVCGALRISSFRFDNMLRTAIRSPGRLLLLPATPISNEEGGLTVGKKYYYFVAVYPRDS